MTLHPGMQAPLFTLPDATTTAISLKDFIGHPVVLYFYPKDNTPGCTQEACDFRDHWAEFKKLSVPVIGISKDSPTTHQGFQSKHDLPFILCSDTEGTVCQHYDVWKEKSMYGKTYFGIERTTFLIDGQGNINHIWPKVKVAGHVTDILQKIQELKG